MAAHSGACFLGIFNRHFKPQTDGVRFGGTEQKSQDGETTSYELKSMLSHFQYKKSRMMEMLQTPQATDRKAIITAGLHIVWDFVKVTDEISHFLSALWPERILGTAGAFHYSTPMISIQIIGLQTYSLLSGEVPLKPEQQSAWTD